MKRRVKVDQHALQLCCAMLYPSLYLHFLNSNIINQNLLEHMLLINLMCCVVGC